MKFAAGMVSIIRTAFVSLAVLLIPLSGNADELLFAQAKPAKSQEKGIRKEFLQGLILNIEKANQNKTEYEPTKPVLGKFKGIVLPPDKTVKDNQPTGDSFERAQAKLRDLQAKLAVVKAKVLTGKLSAETAREIKAIKAEFAAIKQGKAPQQKKTNANALSRKKHSKMPAAEIIRLANSGLGDAQYELSERLKLGYRGIAKDKSLGFQWKLEAAKNGHVVAQFKAARDYTLGITVEKNHKKSAYWIRRAANSGHAVAQFFLYEALAKGRGVATNLKEAEIWAKKAYAQKEKLTVSMRRQIHRKYLGDGKVDTSKGVSLLELAGIKKLTRTEIAAMNFKDLIKHAEKGNSDALYELGNRFQWGQRGIAKDQTMSFQWMLKASQAGHLQAQYYTGLHYSMGQGVAIDHKKSVYWLQKAAEKGHGHAQLQLHKKLEKGEGAKKNTARAEIWLNKAVSQNIEFAITHRDIWHKK